MNFTTVYDIANDSVGVQFPLIGLALILIGVAMKWGFGKSGLTSYPLIGVGVFTLLASGALPLWDRHRVMQAVAKGEAQQVEGPIRNWRVLRGAPLSRSSRFYSHFEYFSVRDVDFEIHWDSLEAGFANRGSREDNPSVRLSNGMIARIRYLPIDSPDKPPRIVRIDLASVGWAAAAGQSDVASPTGAAAPAVMPSHIDDAAAILSTAQKAALETRLTMFERTTGHQLVVATVPSLDGQDIAPYATKLANRRGIGRRGQNDGILLLVAPGERQARIAVGRGLETRLPDAAAREIMDMAILPLFRRGDIPAGIDAGASMIIGKLMSQETP